jgi:hypothetical protein
MQKTMVNNYVFHNVEYQDRYWWNNNSIGPITMDVVYVVCPKLMLMQ